jgi:hypothetical protein
MIRSCRLQKKLTFDLTGCTVKLGPFKLGPFKIGGNKEVEGKRGASPFFIFFFADDDIICAQGKGGGLAMWAKADPDLVLKKGLEL